jgi:hypothetical protein
MPALHNPQRNKYKRERKIIGFYKHITFMNSTKAFLSCHIYKLLKTLEKKKKKYKI